MGKKNGEKREQILDAAAAVFAHKGFFGARVADIAAKAKVADGTIYLYFRSKEEIFSVLVRELGHALRAHVAQDVTVGKSRMQVERQGVESFLRFTLEHPGVYRIVQESQFVDESAFRDYYLKLAQGYSAALEDAAGQGQVAPGSAEERAWAMMGISHFLGLRYCLWNKQQPPPEVLDEVMKFIKQGMGTGSKPAT